VLFPEPEPPAAGESPEDIDADILRLNSAPENPYKVFGFF
jgi:hypothetical protein